MKQLLAIGHTKTERDASLSNDKTPEQLNPRPSVMPVSGSYKATRHRNLRLSALFILLGCLLLIGAFALHAQDASFTVIEQGPFGGASFARDPNIVIRNQQQWDAFWAEYKHRASPPAIDFRRDMVIIVAAQGGNTATTLSIARIIKHEKYLEVITTASKGMGLDVLADPIVIVRTAASPLPIVFH